MSSSFGTLFRVSTFGESHGGGVGVVIDGVPPRLPLTVDELQTDLDRRRPGQSRLVTQRDEADQAESLSGVFEGYTTGTPLAAGSVGFPIAGPASVAGLRLISQTSAAVTVTIEFLG